MVEDAPKQSLPELPSDDFATPGSDQSRFSNKAGAWSKESFAAGLTADNAAQTELPDQQPFHAAWNHALSQDDIGVVVSRMTRLLDSAQLPQGMRLSKSRVNPDAVAVVVPQSPPDAIPFTLTVAVPAPSIPVPVKPATVNLAAPTPITSDTKPETESPAASNDPIAFSARMHKTDAPAFELPPAQNERISSEPQATVVIQPAPDSNALRGTVQAIEQTGVGTGVPAASPATPAPSPRVSVIEPIVLPPPAPVAITPIKDISLHIAGPQNVEVRVSELSGEIRVDVRTADPSLARIFEVDFTNSSRSWTPKVSRQRFPLHRKARSHLRAAAIPGLHKISLPAINKAALDKKNNNGSVSLRIKRPGCGAIKIHGPTLYPKKTRNSYNDPKHRKFV